ncbi:MAG: hypothetical protein HKO07_01490 [Pseudomonadales bacterium]|nr:hypothetical protein [Pseudomonadales bacterium]
MTSIASSVSNPALSAPLSGALPQRERDDTSKTGKTGKQETDSASPSNPFMQTGFDPQEKRELAKLAARDREVRAHEAAHASVGGVYAGAPSYTYQRGPDGRNYAVGGEVSIDASPVAGDPQATIIKAQIVRRAALAPAEPSLQDRAVASEAMAMEQNARRELQAERQSSQGDSKLQGNIYLQRGAGLGEAIDAGAGPGALLDTTA